jgi:phospholipid transport system transporter-binding protein
VAELGGASPSTACRLEPREPGHWALSGDLGLETAAGVLAQGEAAFTGVPRTEVDLSGVTDADSAGLAVLIEWVRGACLSGRSITYRSLPPRLAELARIGGVAGLLPIAD